MLFQHVTFRRQIASKPMIAVGFGSASVLRQEFVD
jgi:hypothetical protein